MKLPSIVTAVCAVALQTAFAGDITGTVMLKGTPPPAQDITASVNSDLTCGKMHTEPVLTRFYVVGAGGELADTVVKIKGISGKSTGASAAPLIVDQRGCLYTPYVAAVQTGQKITVKNSDPVMHNIHSSPAVAGNAEDNKAQIPGGAELSFSFAKEEDFLKFKCDVHTWMFAYITVVDSPYFAVTGKDGKFTIKDVPPGKYKLTALHRKASPTGVDQEVEVKADGAKADFTLEVPTAK